MKAAEKNQLDELGYVVLPGFMSAELCSQLGKETEALFAREGERAGSEFRLEPDARRLANMVDKGEIFERIISMPEILEYIGYVLGPEFKLSSLNARAPLPYTNQPQPLHADMGLVPDAKGYAVCNTLWMLDDFTVENGGTRVVPGSHLWGKLPQEMLPDPYAPHPDEIIVTGKAGTVVVFNSHAWHGGTANRTADRRLALHGFYVRRDLPQQQYQKALLRPETQAHLTPELRRILALDDPLNDELSAAGHSKSGFLK